MWETADPDELDHRFPEFQPQDIFGRDDFLRRA
jgi:hypothetical protein